MTTFADTGIDARLLRALSKRGFNQPTLVQQEVIPKALEGKDVVARARTGSGKTLAYLLPALHRLLADVQEGQGNQLEVGASFQAIILVPTRELCEQVRGEAQEVCQHCGVDLLATALTCPGGAALKRAVATAGQVVVATPGKLAAAIKEGALQQSALQQRLKSLVLDEADLLLSYGYEPDLQLMAPLIPRSCQVMLMSATSSQEVEQLQKLVLHNPIQLNLLADSKQAGGADDDLAAGSGVSSTITHWSMTVVDPADKLLVIMALLKLGLVRKKVLVFVNSVNEAFRVKLFLESFGVRAALLNAEMPLNSRSHCLAAFNKGMFDYLIATDDVHAMTHDTRQQASKKRKKGQDATNGKGKSGPSKDEEFGVTRGIDFKGVRTIVNYDLPSSLQGYVHRVGRTGRAGEEGAALTLFTPQDELFMLEVKNLLKPAGAQHGAGNAQHGDGVVSDADDSDSDAEGQGEGGASAGLQPFTRLTKSQLEALRYRGEDVARSITKKGIKEARARELRIELLNNDKLKEYFESHQAERQLLRHDKALHKTQQAAHLKHLPAYLKDASQVTATAAGNASSGALPEAKRRRLPKSREELAQTGVTGAMEKAITGSGGNAGNVDPLKSVGAVKGFVKAPKRGGHGDEEMTEMEKKAYEKGLKEAKKRAKAEGKQFIPKKNVRKFKRHR